MYRKIIWAAMILTMALAIGCQKDPAEIFVKAEAYRKKGQTELAIMEYKRVIKIQPQNAMAHLGLGLALLDQGKRDEARENFEIVIKLGGASNTIAEANHHLGNMALEDGDPTTALGHYNKVPGIDPQKILDARITLVKHLLAKGDEVAAINEILSLMGLPERPPEVDALLQDPVTEQARSKIRSHLIIAAESKIKEGKILEARSLLEQSLHYPAGEAEDPLRIDAAWAIVHSEVGKCEKAKELWDKIVKADPERKPEVRYYSIVCGMQSSCVVRPAEAAPGAAVTPKEGCSEAALEALRSFEAISKDDPFFDRAQARIPDVLKLIATKRFKVCLEKVHVRNGPSLKRKIINKWPLTTEVRVIEKANKNWYRINYEGKHSAFMHENVITDRPIAVNVKMHGWEKAESQGWMLAFRPVVNFKLTNLSTDPMTSIRIRMVVKQGRKTLSDDKFKVEISDKSPLKPDASIIVETPANIRVELLTRPEKTSVKLYVSLDGSDFVLYRSFALHRDVLEVKEEEGG